MTYFNDLKSEITSFGMSLFTDPILLEVFSTVWKKKSQLKLCFKAVIVCSYVKLVYYDHTPRAEIHTLRICRLATAMHSSTQVFNSSSSYQFPPLGSNHVQLHGQIHKVMTLIKGKTETGWSCYDQEYVKLALATLNVHILGQVSTAWRN